MTHKEVPVTQELENALMTGYIKSMSEVSDLPPYEQVVKMRDHIVSVYKDAYVTGYHQGAGDNIINQVKDK